jgi:hypothetical protein
MSDNNKNETKTSGSKTNVEDISLNYEEVLNHDGETKQETKQETKKLTEISTDDFSNLQTGDILLFNDDVFAFKHKKWSDYLFGILDSAIKFFTNSKYNHCGIVIKDPQFTDPPLKGYYMMHSGSENFGDAENDRSKIGVQLSDLKEAIDLYPGNVYVRRLHTDRNQEFYDKLARAHNFVHNIPYDMNPIDWIRVELGLWKEGEPEDQKLDKYWCSALVSFMYTQLGLLAPDTPWSFIKPVQLGTEHKEEELKFINCTLDPELEIKKAFPSQTHSVR